MRKLPAIIDEVRPVNCLMASFAVWLGASVPAGHPIIKDIGLYLGMLSAFSLLAFANILNGVNDASIDRVKGRGQYGQSVRSSLPSWSLLLLAMTISFFASIIYTLSYRRVLPPFFFVICFLGVLIYEYYLKKKGLSGNILVGVLIGSLFIYGSLHSRPGFSISLIAAISVLSTLSREVIKDIEDMGPDSVSRRTLPHRIGMLNSSIIALIPIVLCLPLSIALYLIVDGSIVFLGLVLLSSLSMIVFASSVVLDPNLATKAQKAVKASQAVSMIGFLSLIII